MPHRSVYARIQDVRDEGAGGVLANTTLYPDARVLTLLERATDMVERLTQQHFGPIRKHFYRDGRNGRQIEEPDANKILEVEKINLVLPDHTTFTLSPQVYVVYDRSVKLRRGETGLPSERAVKEGGEAWTLNNYSKTRREITLPDELHNAEVFGTFGWMEPSVPKNTFDPAAGGKIVLSSKEVTMLSAAVNVGDTVVSVANTGSFKVDDVLHIDPRQSNFWVIVGGVWKLYATTLETVVNGTTQVKLTTLGPVAIGDVVTITDGTTTVKVTVTALDLLNSRIVFSAVVLPIGVTVAIGATASVPAPAAIVVQWFATTTGVLIPGGTQVRLNDVSQTVVGDVVTIDDGNTQTTVVVTAIDTGSGTIFFAPCVMVVFNALSPGSIAAGATVIATRNVITPGYVTIDPAPDMAVVGAPVLRWGRVPRDIKEATLRALFANRGGLFQDPSQSPANFYLNKSEKTDNYQYEKFPIFKKPVNIFAGTGDPIADTILSRFRAPLYGQYV